MMVSNFHQRLWDSWRNGTLNWSQFDYSDIPGASSNKKWHNTDQRWVLQDQEKFYYPLFGLGARDHTTTSMDGLVAIIGQGPAHNTGWLWDKFTSKGCRSGIVGPPEEHAQAWQVIRDGVYLGDFDRQKRIWEEVRRDLGDAHNLCSNLIDLAAELIEPGRASDAEIEPFK